VANPTITFNTSTGSDSLASGAGPATAINDVTESSTVTYSGTGPYTITFSSATDLSGVVADGSHVLYLATSTGRRFFNITAVDDGADTVDVTEAPAGTTSGLSWAIGGKRATLDDTNSRLIFSADNTGRWIIELEDDQTLTTALLFTFPDNRGADTSSFQSDTPGTRRTITCTIDDPVIRIQTNIQNVFSDLILKNSLSGTKTDAQGVECSTAVELTFHRCIFGDPAGVDNLYSGLERTGNSGRFYFYDTLFINCETNGVGLTWQYQFYHSCAFIGNAYGWRGFPNGNVETAMFVNCLFSNNTLDGMFIDNISPGYYYVINCTFADNTGSGIRQDATTGVWRQVVIQHSIFANNGDYGLEFANEAQNQPLDYNNFFGNTTGDRLNAVAGPNDTTFDPEFVLTGQGDSLDNDYTPTNASLTTHYTTGLGVIGSKSYKQSGAIIPAAPAGGGPVNVFRPTGGAGIVPVW
jgi:hypothetical protein